jgi:hypothetical protein
VHPSARDSGRFTVAEEEDVLCMVVFSLWSCIASKRIAPYGMCITVDIAEMKEELDGIDIQISMHVTLVDVH